MLVEDLDRLMEKLEIFEMFTVLKNEHFEVVLSLLIPILLDMRLDHELMIGEGEGICVKKNVPYRLRF